MKSVAIGKSCSAIVLALSLAGCWSSPSVQVGQLQDSGAASSGASEVWTGYLEGVVLMGESSTTWSAVSTDQVTLTFETRSASGVTGTAVFGSGSPPPVDPTVAPYSGSEYDQGYPFPMHEGTQSGSRVQFAIYVTDRYDPWCKLQTPYLCNDPSNSNAEYYSCRPCVSSCIHGEDPICEFCGVPEATLCQCTASGCSVGLSAVPVAFDLTFQGDVGNGTALGVNVAQPSITVIPVNVRLARAQ
jgi:hypothetical protein